MAEFTEEDVRAQLSLLGFELDGVVLERFMARLQSQQQPGHDKEKDRQQDQRLQPEKDAENHKRLIQSNRKQRSKRVPDKRTQNSPSCKLENSTAIPYISKLPDLPRTVKSKDTKCNLYRRLTLKEVLPPPPRRASRKDLEERRQPQEEKESPDTSDDIVNNIGIGVQEQLEAIDPEPSSSNRKMAIADVVNRKPKRFASEPLPISPTLRERASSASVSRCSKQPSIYRSKDPVSLFHTFKQGWENDKRARYRARARKASFSAATQSSKSNSALNRRIRSAGAIPRPVASLFPCRSTSPSDDGTEAQGRATSSGVDVDADRSSVRTDARLQYRRSSRRSRTR